MRQPRTIVETTVEGAADALRRAGVDPGRRLRIAVEYLDLEAGGSARTVAAERLDALLGRHPVPPEAAGMSEEEIMRVSDRIVDEVRATTGGSVR